MRLPSLKYLRTFQVAGKHLSFKKAAEELSVTPSAVSHQVKNLEEFLGVSLFDRQTRSLAFTAAGRNYFEFLNGMFERLESETRQLGTQYGRSIVRLSVPPFFANEALLPRLASFQSSYADTDIRVTTVPSAMRTHPPEADLSILLGKDSRKELITYRLFKHRVVTACAPSLLKEQGKTAFDNLDGQTLIVHELREDSWQRWAAALGVDSPRPKKLIRFDSMSAVARAAERGLGIALVAWPTSREWFRSGALVRLFDIEIEVGDEFYLVHRPDDVKRAEVRNLAEWIVKEFKDFA